MTDGADNSELLDCWDIAGTVAWIKSRGLNRVTLQFPDELLPESTLVAAAVQHECTRRDVPAQVGGRLSERSILLSAQDTAELPVPAGFSVS